MANERLLPALKTVKGHAQHALTEIALLNSTI